MAGGTRYRLCSDTISPVNASLPRWVTATFVGLFFTAAAAIGAWSVELPYFAFSPGPVGDAIDVVQTDDSIQIYRPTGELFFLTVSLQEINVYEAITAAIDPSIDLVRRQAVRRDDESDEEFKERTLDAMDQSIDTAEQEPFGCRRNQDRHHRGQHVRLGGKEVADVGPDHAGRASSQRRVDLADLDIP